MPDRQLSQMDNLEEPINLKSPKSIVSLGVFLLLLLYIGYRLAFSVELKMNHRYTVGTIIGFQQTSKGIYVDYEFKVNSVTFTSAKQPTNEGPASRREGRYYVKYLPRDPSAISDILWDKPVSEKIVDIPINGWEEIPENFKND